MSRWSTITRISGLLPMGFAASALAQPAPQLEIDFVNATLPLSPMLTVAIAIVVGALGVYALRRTRARGGLASWMAAAVAAGALAALITQMHPIRDAAAMIAQPFPLSVSPALVAVPGPNVYLATNTTNTNMTLVAVKLNNPLSGQFIYMPLTTCVAGLTLAPGGSCLVDVSMVS